MRAKQRSDRDLGTVHALNYFAKLTSFAPNHFRASFRSGPSITMETFTAEYIHGYELRLVVNVGSAFYQLFPSVSSLISRHGQIASISAANAALFLCSGCTLAPGVIVPFVGSAVRRETLNRFAAHLVAHGTPTAYDLTALQDIRGQLTQAAVDRSLQATDFVIAAQPVTPAEQAQACHLWPITYGMFKSFDDALVAARLAPSQSLTAQRINASGDLFSLHRVLCESIGAESVTQANAFTAALQFNSFELLPAELHPHQLSTLADFRLTMKWEFELARKDMDTWTHLAGAVIRSTSGLDNLKTIAAAGDDADISKAISVLIVTFTRAGTIPNENGLRALNLALNPYKESLLPRALPANVGPHVGLGAVPPVPTHRSPIQLAESLIQSQQDVRQHQPARKSGAASEDGESSAPTISGSELNACLQRNWAPIQQARALGSPLELLDFVLNSDNALLMRALTSSSLQGDPVFAEIYASGERLPESFADYSFRSVPFSANDAGTHQRWKNELLQFFREKNLRKMITAPPNVDEVFDMFKRVRAIFTLSSLNLSLEESLADADIFEQFSKFFFALNRCIGYNHAGGGLQELRAARGSLAAAATVSGVGSASTKQQVGSALLSDLKAAHQEFQSQIRQHQLLFMQTKPAPVFSFHPASTQALVNANMTYTQFGSAMKLLGFAAPAAAPRNREESEDEGPAAKKSKDKGKGKGNGSGGGAGGGGGGGGGGGDDGNSHWKHYRREIGRRSNIIQWTDAGNGNVGMQSN